MAHFEIRVTQKCPLRIISCREGWTSLRKSVIRIFFPLIYWIKFWDIFNNGCFWKKIKVRKFNNYINIIAPNLGVWDDTVFELPTIFTECYLAIIFKKITRLTSQPESGNSISKWGVLIGQIQGAIIGEGLVERRKKPSFQNIVSKRRMGDKVIHPI